MMAFVVLQAVVSKLLIDDYQNFGKGLKCIEG